MEDGIPKRSEKRDGGTVRCGVTDHDVVFLDTFHFGSRKSSLPPCLRVNNKKNVDTCTPRNCKWVLDDFRRVGLVPTTPLLTGLNKCPPIRPRQRVRCVGPSFRLMSDCRVSQSTLLLRTYFHTFIWTYHTHTHTHKQRTRTSRFSLKTLFLIYSDSNGWPPPSPLFDWESTPGTSGLFSVLTGFKDVTPELCPIVFLGPRIETSKTQGRPLRGSRRGTHRPRTTRSRTLNQRLDQRTED